MASGSLTIPTGEISSGATGSVDLGKIALRVLWALGSLRITVWFFFLAIVIIFVGTLAQDESTIVDVKKEYFNSWIATIPLDVFKPITIWPLDKHDRLPFSFPFPGGATIGIVLLINLIAAKLTRFQMTAKGAKLVAGLAFCLVGATITTIVILGAHAEDGLQGEPPFSYDLLWQICRVTIWVSTFLVSGWFLVGKVKTSLAYWTLLVVALSLGVWSLAWIFYEEALRIPNPGLRIVWQMSKSLIAGIILLVGLTLLFGKRGGNVLIHLAVGLMMLGQFIFGDRQIEERISISDGEVTNVAIRPDEIELAFIDSSDPLKDHVVAIDGRQLASSYRYQKPITHPELPLKFVVKKKMENSNLDRVNNNTSGNIATAGAGLAWLATSAEKFGGAVEKRENVPSVYVELSNSKTNAVIGTYLLSSIFNDKKSSSFGLVDDIYEYIEIDGKKLGMALRNRRTYKDYEVTLKDVQRVNYSGTSMVRDYSSFVEFKDSLGKEVLDGRIWMNNPIRFQGETFYQSGFYPSGSEIFSNAFLPKDTTVLQVVTNAGWLMPYIACAFAALGMFSHFGGTFVRFASRFDRERKQSESVISKNAKSPSYRNVSPKNNAHDEIPKNQLNQVNFWTDARAGRNVLAGRLLPLVVVSLVGSAFMYYASPRSIKTGEFNWYEAGKLPVQHEGRIKPLDTVARNMLQALSGKTSTIVRAADIESAKTDTKYSATQWFYGLMAGEEWVEKAKIFRIDAKEVLDIFNLDPEDSGGTLDAYAKIMRHDLRHRYSFAQINAHMDKFQERYRPIIGKLSNREATVDSLSFPEQKILELNEKLNIFGLIRFAYSINSFPLPPKDLENKDAIDRFLAEMRQETKMIDQLLSGKPAGMLPPIARKSGSVISPEDERNNRWQALRPARFTEFFGPLIQRENIADARAVAPLQSVLDSVGGKDGSAFNRAIQDYQRVLSDISTAKPTLEKTSFEAWYNKFGAFSGCMAFYIVAFLLTLLSFVMFPQTLRRTAFWTVAVVFVVHVVAIASRVYITERAPVISLYSSAVFIGCAAVLFGLVVELLFPMRIGLIVGSVLGSTTLLVSFGLEKSDTMPVLEAVLDTQFWLTTHVQCITLGYVATFFAGFLAIFAIIHRLFTVGSRVEGKLVGEQAEMHRILTRLIYGTICFATFFSFIGTVLGGLWADDSWGRFWGWDPKENGALMIVLWNAIVLHSRWDKLVREQGIALLAIGGNIITAWSWFGTNQLGIGLHSYGFTSAVLQILGWFVLSQFVVIAIGLGLVLFTKKSSSFESLPHNRPVGSWE